MPLQRYFLPLAGLFWLASWVVRAGFPPWTSFPGETLAFLGLGLMAAHTATTGSIPTRLPAALTGLGLLLMGSMVYQQAAGRALTGDLLLSAAYVGATGLALYLGITSAHKTALLKALATTHLLGAAISAVVIALQWVLAEEAPFPIPAIPRGWRPSAFFDQPNHAATFVLSGLFCAVYLRQVGHLANKVFWPLLVLLSLGLQIANSRTALLALVLVTVLWLFKTRAIQTTGRWWTTALPLAAVWLANLGTRLFLDWVWPLLLNTTAAPRAIEADPIRLGLWQQIWAGALQKPWAGHGWLQTASAQYAGALEHPFKGSVGTNFAHNLVLDLAAWAGIPVAVLAVVLLCRLAYLWVQQANSLEQVFALLIALPFVVHSGLEYPFAYAYLLLPYALYLGLAYGPAAHGDVGSNLSSFRWFWGLSGALVVATTLWTVQHYLALEEDIRLLRFQDRRIVLKEVPNTDRSSPFDQLTLIKQALGTHPSPDMPGGALEPILQLRNRYSGAAYQARYITALMYKQQTQAAQLEFDRLVAVHGAAMGRELTRILQEDHGLAPPWAALTPSSQPGL